MTLFSMLLATIVAVTLLALAIVLSGYIRTERLWRKDFDKYWQSWHDDNKKRLK